MKTFLLAMIFITSLLATNKPTHSMLPDKELFSLLKTIDSQAITMGEGEKKVFVFLDPLCKFSRKFIKTVRKNPLTLEKYKYKIFLYEIPRLKSTQIINSIYSSQNKLQTLLKVMLENKKDFQINPKTLNTKDITTQIKHVAKKLDVYKRPYIILQNDSKGF